METRATPFAPGHRLEPLSSFNLCNSTDVDEVRQSVRQRFCDHKLQPMLAKGRLDARFNFAQGHNIGLGYLRYGSDVTIEPGYLETFYLLQIPIQGNSEVRNGRDHALSGPGSGTILNPTRSTLMHMAGDCEKVLLLMDRQALHLMVERQLGFSLSHPIVFSCLVSFQDAKLQQWQRKLGACIGATSAGSLFNGARLGAQMLIEEELISEFVQIQASNVRHFFDHPQPNMLPKHLRRAQAYLHDTMAEPVTISQVAEEAGVSARCLQIAFQKQFGCSPLQYLRRLRFDLARYELQNALPGQTVSDLAFSLGFTHLGRFAISYREHFGETPSETLATARAGSSKKE